MENIVTEDNSTLFSTKSEYYLLSLIDAIKARKIKKYMRLIFPNYYVKNNKEKNNITVL